MLAVHQWGTKSFEFWTLEQVVLSLVRPASIVEFGSGRSTSHLAEYAMKKDATYVSVEQNRAYARKIKRGLRNSFLDPAFVHHVSLADDGWYDGEALQRLIKFVPDLLFIDGPVGTDAGFGPGSRVSWRGRRWYKSVVPDVKVLIMDDLQSQSNFEMFRDLLAGMSDRMTLYMAYEPLPGYQNVLAVTVPSAHGATVMRLCAVMGIDLFTDHTVERCREP
jgi:hypothetical protein